MDISFTDFASSKFGILSGTTAKSANHNTFELAYCGFGGDVERGETWHVHITRLLKHCGDIMNSPSHTMLTDERNEALSAIKKLLPLCLSFLCSIHRKKSTSKGIKSGGKLFDLLLYSKDAEDLAINLKHIAVTSPKLWAKIVKYNLENQFECANNRVMHGTTDTNNIECMFAARGMARICNLVKSAIKLIKDAVAMQNEQYDMAIKWDKYLTPYATEILTDLKTLSARFTSVQVRECN
jgi:hypothetical protein